MRISDRSSDVCSSDLIGDSFRLPNGETVEVVARTRLCPAKLVDGWDSRDSIFEGEEFGPLTIESLRRLLQDAADPEEVKDLLSQALAEDAEDLQIYEGIRRDRIIKIDLKSKHLNSSH